MLPRRNPQAPCSLPCAGDDGSLHARVDRRGLAHMGLLRHAQAAASGRIVSYGNVGLAAGGSVGPSPAAAPVISSKTIRVVDGPVAGAKVYVDLNDNG